MFRHQNQDNVYMVAKTYVAHSTEIQVPQTSEMEKVPHSSEAERENTIQVTLEIVIKAPISHMDIEVHTPYTTTKAPSTDDMTITPPVETNVTAPYQITPTLTNPSIHMDEGFPGGPNEYSILTGYVDHVAFKLWQ